MMDCHQLKCNDCTSCGCLFGQILAFVPPEDGVKASQNRQCSCLLLQGLHILSKGVPKIDFHKNGLVQEWRNSIALAMELRLSCSNP